jgi:hypothetical protein
MRTGVSAQQDLFQTPEPAIGVPKFLNGKTVELLQALLMEALTAGHEEKNDLESSDDHDHA